MGGGTQAKDSELSVAGRFMTLLDGPGAPIYSPDRGGAQARQAGLRSAEPERPGERYGRDDGHATGQRQESIFMISPDVTGLRVSPV